MREKIIYIANDGKEFATREECKKYENSRLPQSDRSAIKAVRELRNYCKNRECYNCIFNDYECVIDYSEINTLADKVLEKYDIEEDD